MLQIWGRKSSSNVQSIMWCVEELGVKYERFDIGHRFGGTDTQEFYELNPNRTVPVLRDENNPPIWESGAILRYLCHCYAPETFWPNDAIGRTEVDKWAEWSKLNIALEFTVPIFWRVVRTADKDRDETAITSAVLSFETKLKLAETQLSRFPFLAGEQFTLADIQFGHVLYRYFDIDIERSAFSHLSQYYEKLCRRPAYKEHVMIPYEDLRVE